MTAPPQGGTGARGGTGRLGPPGIGTLAEGVELLERALGFTGAALAGVRARHLAAPTPCARWDLADLLTHMADALAAFREASDGLVAVPAARRVPAPSRPDDLPGHLRAEACALLGDWTRVLVDDALTGGSRRVLVGGAASAARLVVHAAALEISVHGWDVARTLQVRGVAAPTWSDALAGDLGPVAAALIGHEDRPQHFAVAREPDGGGALLAWLGRDPAWEPGTRRPQG